MIIDTHCHINKLEYDNLDEIIAELNSIIVINNGTNKETNELVLDLANKKSNFYAAIGYHPEDADITPSNYLELLESEINNPKVVAIGEIGLDYHWRTDNIDKQKEIFIKQLELAQKYDKPVIIHARDSLNDVLTILKNYKVKADLHCFSGSLEMAQEFLKLGCSIGVGGVITFKNARKLVEVVTKLDIKNLLLETDSPALAPEPIRGSKNTPLNTKYIIKEIAKLKNLTEEETIKILNENAIRFFKLKML